MPELVVQPSINDLRSEGMLALVERLRTLHKTSIPNLLVYNFDAAPDSALPFLAWQFDVLNTLWALLGSTASSQRSLLKTAIPLHSKLGVPGTIKKALASLGWPNAVLQEGQASWGGNSYPLSQGWAVCRITVTVENFNLSGIPEWDPSITYPPRSVVMYNSVIVISGATAPAGTVPQFLDLDSVPDLDLITDFDNLIQYPWIIINGSFIPPSLLDLQSITAIFEFFKAERCRLDSVWFNLPGVIDILIPAPTDAPGFIDVLLPAPHDTYTFSGQPVADVYAFPPTHNTRQQHAGLTYANTPVGPLDGASTKNGTPIEGNK